MTLLVRDKQPVLRQIVRAGLDRFHRQSSLRCAARVQRLRSLRVHTRAYNSAERVLRYVDGRERRIIYPSADSVSLQDLVIADADGVYRSFSETEQPDRWGPPEWDVVEAWSGGAHPQNVTEPAAPCSSPQTADRLPDLAQDQQLLDREQQGADAADVLEQLFAQFEGSAYLDAQQQLWQQVSDSYQVLETCPWPLPRQLYVLAVQQLTGPAPAMFTLRTRIRQLAAETELGKVLGHARRSNGAALVAMHRMAEGVVTFCSEAAAQRFGAALEADGSDDVSIAVVDSHALFRTTGEGSAVVVLVNQDGDQGFQASPGELEASLRGRGEEAFS